MQVEIRCGPAILYPGQTVVFRSVCARAFVLRRMLMSSTLHEPDLVSGLCVSRIWIAGVDELEQGQVPIELFGDGESVIAELSAGDCVELGFVNNATDSRMLLVSLLR